MKDTLKIFNHFGVDTQSRKLVEEVYEFLHEVSLYEAGVGSREKVLDEFCDMSLVLYEFQDHFDITSAEKWDGLTSKRKRTLERIDSGYYDKK